MPIITAAIGFVMLILGRQFYGVFVGGCAYLATIYILRFFGRGQSQMELIIVPLVIGILAMALTFYMKRFAAYLAGFVAGWFIFSNLAEAIGAGSHYFTWLPLTIAGVCGALVLFPWFDVAMVLLSTVLGAILIVTSIHLPFNQTIAFTLSVVIGLAAQIILLQYGHPSPD